MCGGFLCFVVQIGVYRGAGERPKENRTASGSERSFPLDSFQELLKIIIYQCFLKFLRFQRTFFKKFFGGVQG